MCVEVVYGKLYVYCVFFEWFVGWGDDQGIGVDVLRGKWDVCSNYYIICFCLFGDLVVGFIWFFGYYYFLDQIVFW